jgi:hypothetical protein
MGVATIPQAKDEKVDGPERPWRHRLWTATRLGAGSLLLAASLLKAHFLLTRPFLSYTGVFSSRWTSVLLVEVELLMGLWLLFGVAPRLTRALALLLFAGLGAAAAMKVWAGDPDCGCLGQLPVKPWQMLCLDVGVLAALVASRPSQRAWLPRGLSPVLPTGLALALGAALAYHPIFVHSDILEDGVAAWGQVIVLEPKKWSGPTFPLRNQVLINENLDQGFWTIVLFRMHCEQCRKVIDRFHRLAEQAEAEEETEANQTQGRVALIEVPPFSGQGKSLLRDRRQFAYGQLNPEFEWFFPTPVIVQVMDGKVVRVLVADQAGSCEGCTRPHFMHE